MTMKIMLCLEQVPLSIQVHKVLRGQLPCTSNHEYRLRQTRLEMEEVNRRSMRYLLTCKKVQSHETANLPFSIGKGIQVIPKYLRIFPISEIKKLVLRKLHLWASYHTSSSSDYSDDLFNKLTCILTQGFNGHARTREDRHLLRERDEYIVIADDRSKERWCEL